MNLNFLVVKPSFSNWPHKMYPFCYHSVQYRANTRFQKPQFRAEYLAYLTNQGARILFNSSSRRFRFSSVRILWRPFTWREKDRWWSREISTTHEKTDNPNVKMTRSGYTMLLSNRGNQDRRLSPFSETIWFSITEACSLSESKLLWLNITSYRFFGFFMKQYCWHREIYHHASESSICRMILCTAWNTWEHKNTFSLLA